MKRLTTDTPKNNSETLMNYCTADKDGWAVLKYAGGDENIKLHEYTAKCCQEHGCKHRTADFVAEDGLFDCYDCPVAIMYYCGSQAAENNARLSAYEDTEFTPEEIERLKEEHYEALDEASDLAVETFKVVEENLKLRRLLKLAMEDIATAASDFCECSEFCEFCSFCKYRKENDICEYRMNHNDCINASGFRWQYADEVEEVLKDGE